ncbi:MAG: transcriptional regulator [Deltaproteobacteria bacterium]|nr:transcriptional regulator [Deltaproteobacteria bacterium]
MVFIESPLLSRRVSECLGEDEYAALQWALTLHPESGAVIPGSGGVRKLRWSAERRGKRGGVRVVYYWRDTRGEIWLLTIYDKHETENIPGHILKKLREELVE